jgi:hypothetical protein
MSRWIALVAAVILLPGAAARGIPPVKFRERLVGHVRATADGFEESRRLAFDLRCADYLGDIACEGRFRYRREPPYRQACVQRRARLELRSLSRRTDGLSWDVVLEARAHGGDQCTFVGTIPYLFVFTEGFPSLSGRFECRDAAGASVDAGVFGAVRVAVEEIPPSV